MKEKTGRRFRRDTMKFTEGYWCIKKEMTPLYAVEYADSRRNDNELIVYAPGKHIADRGDCLNLGMLTIRLTSPMEDVGPPFRRNSLPRSLCQDLRDIASHRSRGDR